MDNIIIDKQDSELLSKICKIFNVFPEELQYDLPGGIGTKKAQQIITLIQTSVQEAIISKLENIIDDHYYDQGDLYEFECIYLQDELNKYINQLKDSSKKG